MALSFIMIAVLCLSFSIIASAEEPANKQDILEATQANEQVEGADDAVIGIKGFIVNDDKSGSANDPNGNNSNGNNSNNGNNNSNGNNANGNNSNNAAGGNNNYDGNNGNYGGNQGSSGISPQTGDSSHLEIYTVLACISLLILCVSFLYNNKSIKES